MGSIWGDVPTWITTLAVLLAVVQYLGERKRRRSESDREAREQATNLTVWTVTVMGTDRRYGVRISNTSGSTFHDVRIHALIHGEARRPIKLLIVPPGDHFVPFNGNDHDYTWDLARDVAEEDSDLRPYMQSDKYRVTSVQFRDNVGQQWATDDRAVLRAGGATT